MKSSYPSRAAFIFDVPEPAGIDSKFVYRYFQRNEKISTDTRGTEQSFLRHGSKHAREIVLRFTPAVDSINIGTGQSSLQFTDREKAIIFAENLDKITSELSVGANSMVSIVVQDSGANAKLQHAIESSLALNNKNVAGLSPIQKILRYGSISEEADAQSVLDYANVDASNEFLTFDPKTGEPISKVGEGDVGKLSFALSLNAKFASDILTRSKNSALSPISDSLDPILGDVSTISSNSISSDPSKTIDITDYEPSTEPVSTSAIDLDTISVYGNTLLGYLITKRSVEPDGSLMQLNRFVINNPRQDTHVDTEIVYGKRYRYEIQTVYLVRILSYDGKNIVSSDYIISSRQSPATEVLCEEGKPPPEPIDLRFWFSPEKKLHVEWQHPLNKQEDIKRYQVFRRRNINEPFQLLAELDFDDSAVKTPRSEKIPSRSKLVSNYPVSFYIDDSYNLDSDYIYAVCSVDARDLSSGYSEQFRVRFQREHGKLRVDRVASAGAPKPYPNFTLDAPLTVDSMKTSGYSKAKIYFDPDYLQVYDLREKDLGHISTSKDYPSYSIQFINVDLQQDAKVSFSVIDNK